MIKMFSITCLVFTFFSAVSHQSPNLCKCPRGGQPSEVCGDDGQTYWNTCLAVCHNATVQCQGQCPCDTEEKVEIRGNIYTELCQAG